MNDISVIKVLLFALYFLALQDSLTMNFIILVSLLFSFLALTQGKGKLDQDNELSVWQ